MGFMSKVFEVIGFEGSSEESSKTKKTKKQTKASFKLKKNVKEKPDNIDGIAVFYPSSFADGKQLIKHFKNDEAFIINVEDCDEKDGDKILCYLQGGVEILGGKMICLEKDCLYIFLPEGVEIEE